MTQAAPGPEQSLLSHLLELRSRLLRSAAGILVCLVPLAVYARELYALLAAPLLRLMPPGGGMIATEVASPFLTPFKLAAVCALVLAMPWVLYQLWAFVAPGLYRNERRLVAPLLFSSTLLFYCGVAFAYFLVLPAAFRVLVAMAPPGVVVMTDISKYLDFVLTLFVAFGLAFETPVAIVILVRTGFVTVEQLAASRGYVLVIAFVLGAIFTPPDVLSQILLAVPMYLLFELGLLAARWVRPAPGPQPAPQPR